MLIKHNQPDADIWRSKFRQLTYTGVIAAIIIPIVTVAFWQPDAQSESTQPVPTYAFDQSHPHTVPVLTAPLTNSEASGGSIIQVEDGALVAVASPMGVTEIAPSGSSEIRVYTVREGDTLSHVAEMFGVTTNTILWANDLPKATQIRPDDTLVILPVSGVQHEVTAGDTIGGIADMYDGDAEEILAYNELSDADSLAVGDLLLIPGGTIQSVQARAASAKPVQISGSTAAASNGLIHPVPGAIRTQGLHGNNAIDFAAGHGTPIRAAAAGEVIVSKSSGWNGGYGQYIVVRHNNGTQTLYSHLSSNYVGVGAWVAQGEVLGGMGNTGRSTGTHLHFEVRGARNPF